MPAEREEPIAQSQIDTGGTILQPGPQAGPQPGTGPEADPWEAAYLRFETPEQEIQKFIRRLHHLGAEEWPRDSEIVELFCGRGNGLHALERLGFTRLEGVDLSRGCWRSTGETRNVTRQIAGNCRLRMRVKIS